MKSLMSSLLFLTIFVCLILPTTVMGQTITATVSGTVTDQANAVVPGAKIVVVSNNTGQNKVVTSDSEGRFVVPFLQPGEYKVTVEANGFSKVVRSGINLEIGQTATLNFSLNTQALLFFNLLMIAGYLGFGRLADRMTRQGRSTLPLLVGGVALASLCLALLASGLRTGNLLLWGLFFGSSTSVVLSYSLFSRRYPTEMVGRVNSALNVSVFIGMFSGQWAVGAVLSLWPPTAAGYAPEAYPWALGGLWLMQAAGLAWLWSGRRLFN